MNTTSICTWIKTEKAEEAQSRHLHSEHLCTLLLTLCEVALALLPTLYVGRRSKLSVEHTALISEARFEEFCSSVSTQIFYSHTQNKYILKLHSVTIETLIFNVFQLETQNNSQKRSMLLIIDL